MGNIENKNELKEIGFRLKQVRNNANLLQNQMPINKNQYSNYEQGLYAMNIITLKQICLKLNTSADYLLGLPNEFETVSKDKQSVWYVIKNLSDDKIQQLKGMLIFLANN